MGFTEAVRTCFSKYLHMAGRAKRPEYWWFLLFTILATAVASVVDGVVFGFETEQTPGNHPVTMVVSFLVFFPSLAAGWRRMHDTGHPGWYVLLPQIVFLIGVGVFMIGLFGAAAVEDAEVGPGPLSGPASVVGYSAAGVLVAAVIAAVLFKVWWLTRPGDPAPNAYGPPPA